MYLHKIVCELRSISASLRLFLKLLHSQTFQFNQVPITLDKQDVPHTTLSQKTQAKFEWRSWVWRNKVSSSRHKNSDQNSRYTVCMIRHTSEVKFSSKFMSKEDKIYEEVMHALKKYENEFQDDKRIFQVTYFWTWKSHFFVQSRMTFYQLHLQPLPIMNLHWF